MTSRSPTIGIIANPASARDIRRVVANASNLQTADRVNIVLRLLSGLASQGVDRVLMMPDKAGVRALLVRALKRAGASLIAFDLLFTDRQDPVEEAAFAQTIRDAGNVLLAAAREGRGEEAAETVGAERLDAAERMRAKAPPWKTMLRWVSSAPLEGPVVPEV